jgi:hypothetical protein
MLGRVYAFIDRYSNGDVHPIGLTKQECDELLAYVEKNWRDDDEDEGATDPPATSSQAGKGSGRASGTPAPLDDDDETYGLD